MTPTAAPAPGAVSLRERITEGLFPILGATTFLCLLVGALFRLSHAALQLANYAVAALQLVLLTGLRGILGWSLVAPLLGLVLYAVLLPLVRGLARGLRRLQPAQGDAA